MNNSAAKVGEIFTEAGAAFNKLAEMTMMLHPMAEQQSRFKDTYKSLFNELINTISGQAKTPVKRKAIDDRPAAPSNNSGQVTLNMLNAPESEMEAESLRNDVKLEFESSTEEVAS